MRIRFDLLIRDPIFWLLIVSWMLFFLISFLHKSFTIKNAKKSLNSITRRLDAVYLPKGIGFNEAKKRVVNNDSINNDFNVILNKSLNIVKNEISNSDLTVGMVGGLFFVLDINSNDFNLNGHIGTRIRVPLNRSFNINLKSKSFFDSIKYNFNFFNKSIVENRYVIDSENKEIFSKMLQNNSFKENIKHLPKFSLYVEEDILTLFVPEIVDSKNKISNLIFSSVGFVKLLYSYGSD